MFYYAPRCRVKRRRTIWHASSRGTPRYDLWPLRGKSSAGWMDQIRALQRRDARDGEPPRCPARLSSAQLWSETPLLLGTGLFPKRRNPDSEGACFLLLSAAARRIAALEIVDKLEYSTLWGSWDWTPALG
jgi:hypothetical protein